MKLRTRRENASRKGLRILNERKDAKAVARASTSTAAPSRGSPPPVAGEQFDKLTAVESAGIDAGGNLRWSFACVCGERVTWRVSTVRANVRRLGWCSCKACYRAAGGWRDIETTREAAGAREELPR